MTKRELKSYRTLEKEIETLEKEIETLEKKLDAVPVVAGKVQASMPEYPYLPSHVTVDMAEPVQAAAIRRRLDLVRRKKAELEVQGAKIEEFVESVLDPIDRIALRWVFLQGKTYKQAGHYVRLDGSVLAKRVKKLCDDEK